MIGAFVHVERKVIYTEHYDERGTGESGISPSFSNLLLSKEQSVETG